MSKVKKKTPSMSTSMFVEQLMMNSSYDSFGKKISVSQTPTENALDSPKTSDSKEKKKAGSKVKKSVSNLETFQNSSSSKHSVSGNLVNSEGAHENSSTTSKKSRHHKKEVAEEAGDNEGTTTSSTSEASSRHKKSKKSSKHQEPSSGGSNEHGDDTKKAKSETAVGDPAVSSPASTPTKSKLFSKRRSLAQSGLNSGSPQQPQSVGDSLGSDGTGGTQQSNAGKKDEMKLYYDKHSASKDDDSDSGDDYYFDAMGDVIDDDHHRAPLGYETVVKMDGWIRKAFTDKSNRRKERKERDSFESERGSEHSKKTIIPNIFLLKKKKEKGTKHKKSGSGLPDDVSVCTDDSSDIPQPIRSLSQPPVFPGFDNEMSSTSNVQTTENIDTNDNIDDTTNDNSSSNNDDENKQAMMTMIDRQKREQASKHLKSMLRRSHTTAGRLAQLERRVGAAEACMPGKIRDDVFAVCKSLEESARDLRDFMDGMEFEKFMDEQRKELAQTEETVAALVAECEALDARTQGNARRARALRMNIREFDGRSKDSWSERVTDAVSWMFSGLKVDLSYNSKIMCGPSVSLLRKWFKLF